MVRETNSLADFLAKFVFETKHDLLFVNCDVGSLPPPWYPFSWQLLLRQKARLYFGLVGLLFVL